jgi:hypothetical protein
VPLLVACLMWARSAGREELGTKVGRDRWAPLPWKIVDPSSSNQRFCFAVRSNPRSARSNIISIRLSMELRPSEESPPFAGSKETTPCADALGLAQNWGAVIADVVSRGPADAAGSNPSLTKSSRAALRMFSRILDFLCSRIF